MQDPNINKRMLIEELVTSVGLSSNMLIPAEELAAQEQQAAMMMQAQMEAAQGGAPGGMPGGMPPELLAAMGGGEAALPINETAVPGQPTSPEESLAGGGPSPIRE